MGVRSNDHQLVGGKQYFEHEVQLGGNTGLTAGSGFSSAETYLYILPPPCASSSLTCVSQELLESRANCCAR